MACRIVAWGRALALLCRVAVVAAHFVGPEDAGAVVPAPLGTPVGEPNLFSKRQS